MKIYTKDKIILTSIVNVFNPTQVNYIYSVGINDQNFPDKTYGKIAFSFNGVDYYTYDITNKNQFKVDIYSILPIDGETNEVIENNSLDITSLPLLNANDWIKLNDFFPKKTFFYLMLALKSEILDSTSFLKSYDSTNFIVEDVTTSNTVYKFLKLYTDINPTLFLSFKNCSFQYLDKMQQVISYDNGENQQYQSDNLKTFVKYGSNALSALFNTQVDVNILKTGEFYLDSNYSSLIFGFLTKEEKDKVSNFTKNFSTNVILNTKKYSTGTFKLGKLHFKIVSTPELKNITLGTEIDVIELGNKITIVNNSDKDKMLKVVIS